jgi:hypothetical protein
MLVMVQRFRCADEKLTAFMELERAIEAVKP